MSTLACWNATTPVSSRNPTATPIWPKSYATAWTEMLDVPHFSNWRPTKHASWGLCPVGFSKDYSLAFFQISLNVSAPYFSDTTLYETDSPFTGSPDFWNAVHRPMPPAPDAWHNAPTS